MGSQKKYHNLYKRLIESISIPNVDLNKIYNSDYSRHFYIGKEITQFKKKWAESDHGDKSIELKSNSNSLDRKKILIIHPEGNINNNPNLTGIVEILCENNYLVHICSPTRKDICQESPCDGATLSLVDSKNKSFTAGFEQLASMIF